MIRWKDYFNDTATKVVFSMFSHYYSETVTTKTTSREPVDTDSPAEKPQNPAEKSGTGKPVKIKFNETEATTQTETPEETAVPGPETKSEPVVPAGPTPAEAALANEVKRINAEYANYRNRSQRDNAAASSLAVKDTLEKMLPVLDDISAARKYGDLEEGPFASISNKLSSILGDIGLEVLGEVGEEFDPEIHEALLRQPNSEIPEDHVFMILREGYRVGDRLIRAAQVAVSAG